MTSDPDRMATRTSYNAVAGSVTCRQPYPKAEVPTPRA